MNSNNLLQLAQQSFRIAVGATATFVETLQSPEKRSTAFSDLQAELSQKSQQWAEKGEITEREARQALEKILEKTPWKNAGVGTNDRSYPYSTNTTADPTTKAELQSLTEQITALRNELEELRNSNN
jgi:polyhydroxyalkanoate synthesis regulator phasin